MKQFYTFIIALFISFNGFSQLEISNTANGVVSISYGANGDFSLYDPGFDPVTLYLWVPEADNSQGTFYGDDWFGTLVNLTWNGTAHVGEVDLNSYNFNTGGIIPVGTTVNNFNLILRKPDGSSQSSDLTSTDYGYSLSVLPVEDFSKSTERIFTSNNKIHISGLQNNEKFTLSIFNTSGQLVKKVITTETEIDYSELNTSLYFAVLETADKKVIKKKILKF